MNTDDSEFITGDEIRKDILTEFTRSPGSNMGYIRFNSNKVKSTVAILEHDLIVDYDSDNRVTGIEFLDSKTMPEIHEI